MMKEEQYRVYGYRWIILIIFMLVNISLQLLWISFASVTLEAVEYYNVSESEILFLSTIFMIAYIPVTFLASWFINKFGFRIGAGVGALLNGVFGFLRFFAGPNYQLAFIFQTMIAISQPFVLNSVSLLSANWFPESERTTATGLSVISQLLGIALGLIITPLLVEIYGFQVMLFVYGLYSLLIGILFLILARDGPPSPSSASPNKKNIKITGGLKSLLTNYSFWIIIFIFFIGLGAFNMISTYIELIVAPRGLSAIEAGILGGIMLLGGIIGSIIISALSDKLQKRKVMISISILIAFISFFIISFAFDIFLLYLFGFLLGFGLLSSGPVALEYGVDITMPVPEATSNGMLMMVGQIGGIIFILGFENFTTPSGDYLPALIILSILSLVLLILSLFLKDVKKQY